MTATETEPGSPETDMNRKRDAHPACCRGKADIAISLRVDADCQRWIDSNAGDHDISRTEFIKTCLVIGAAMLAENSALLDLSPSEITAKIKKCSKIFVLLENYIEESHV